MSKSQHKEATRECPQCHHEKTFPERNETCSPECGYAQRKGDSVADAVPSALRPGVGESHEVSKDAWTISIPKTTIRTLDELLAHCKVDSNVWDVDRFQVNKWEMASVPRTTGSKKKGWERKSTTPVVTELFQVKAWLKRNVLRQAVVLELAALKEDAKRAAPKVIRMPAPQTTSGVMIEMSIPDLHIGKLAWAKETGHANYDSTIAANLFQDAVASLVERTRSHRAEEICMVLGNDLLNADNLQNTTTKGTPQHSDIRYQKTFRTARLMVTDAIQALRQVARVRVVLVPGNHDQLSAWHLGDSLECFFHGQPDVAIDNNPTQRKFYQWGSVGLMWTHGDKGKHDKYPLLMATERRKMWGDTTWNEIHLGHLHQVGLREINGVRVRILPSLCAPDAWHSEMGYVGNVRSAEAYVWHREYGLLGTAVYVAPDTHQRAA